MNEDEDTISIDLTEDDTDLQNKQAQVKYVNYSANTVRYENLEAPDSQDIGRSYSAPFPPNKVSAEHQDSVLSKNKTQSPLLSDSPEESSINFIENLQKGNPQIETVFIESDEDDNAKQEKLAARSHIKIHDMVIINSPQIRISDADKYSLSNVGSPPKVTTNSEITMSANKILNQTQSPALRKDDVPFTVRAISPSRFNENLAKNSRTIALQDETNKSISRKYLVIPKEVVPFLANSQGPLSLNVPGIGPLLIPKPSDMFSSQIVHGIVKKPYLELKYKDIVKNTPIESVYDPLSDPKYCWRFQSKRKRDLEGFTMSDRLGFYKAEQQRTKMCAAKYQKIFKLLHSSISIKERALMAIRSSRLNMKNIKLVEIDSIKNKINKALLQNKHQDGVKLNKSPVPAMPGEELFFSSRIQSTPIQLSSSESDSSQVGNDLLVTKKVVFINETEQRKGRKRKRRLGQFTNQNRKKLQKRGRNDQVSSDRTEESTITDKSIVLQSKGNKKGRPRKDKTVTTDAALSKQNREQQEDLHNTPNLPGMSSLQDDEAPSNTKNKIFKKGRKYKFNDPKTQVLSLRHPKREQPTDISTIESETQLSPFRIQKMKSCHVEITHNNLVQKALERYNHHTVRCIRKLVSTCKIIDNLKQFQHHIQPIKPILVINEDHCATMDFKDIFCKYNIVFPMSETTRFLDLNITNVLFAESAKKGYIKFVKPRILCRYLAGFREP